MSSKGNKIVFAGGIVTDLVTVTPRFPKPGETLIGKSYSTGFGGKTPNQCFMSCLLGGDVAMVGKVGDDGNGREYLEHFRSHKVDVRGIVTTKGNSTGSATILVNSESGENQIILVTAANDDMTSTDVDNAGAVFAEATAVVSGLEMPLEAVKTALRAGREHGATTILNAAPAVKDLDPEILALTDILCVNETEAEITSGGMPVETMEQVRNILSTTSWHDLKNSIQYQEQKRKRERYLHIVFIPDTRRVSRSPEALRHRHHHSGFQGRRLRDQGQPRSRPRALRQGEERGRHHRRRRCLCRRFRLLPLLPPNQARPKRVHPEGVRRRLHQRPEAGHAGQLPNQGRGPKQPARLMPCHIHDV